jgi:hypothetical protein
LTHASSARILSWKNKYAAQDDPAAMLKRLDQRSAFGRLASMISSRQTFQVLGFSDPGHLQPMYSSTGP